MAGRRSLSSKLPKYQLPSPFTPFLRRFTDERARDLSETITLYNEVRAAHLASLWSQEDAIERVNGFVAEWIGKVVNLPDSPVILQALDHCQKAVLALETTIFSFPKIDWDIAILSLKEQVDLRRFLRAQQHFLANDDRVSDLLTTALGNVFGGLISELPAIPESTDNPTLTVPLVTLMRDPGSTVDKIIGTLLNEELVNAGLFTTLQERLYENICIASGVLPDKEQRKPFVKADESELPPSELVETYLKNTPLLDLFFTPIPFNIPDEQRFEHTHVIAGAGHGKTQLLQHLIFADLSRPNPPALVVIDSQGDMLSNIQKLAIFAPGQPLADRLIIIDPEDVSAPPALNMFDPGDTKRFHTYSPAVRETLEAGTIELYNYIFGSLASEMTQKQGTAFAFIVKLMFVIPGATIRTLRDLMEEEVNGMQTSRFAPFIGRLDEDSQTFFKNQFFHKTAFRQTKEQIAHRLYGVLQTPAFARMFSSNVRKLDMFDALQKGSIVLVNTSKSMLKTEASALFGRYMIALTLHAAYERVAIDKSDWRDSFLIIDEAAEYFDKNIEHLLEQARKFKLGLVVAHQHMEQMDDELKSSINANTSIKLAGGLSDRDAHSLAREMNCAPEFIRARRKTSSGTQFACYVRNYTDTAVSLSIPFGTIENQPQMSKAAHANLLAQNRQRVSAPPEAQKPAAAPVPKPVAPPPVADTHPDHGDAGEPATKW